MTKNGHTRDPVGAGLGLVGANGVVVPVGVQDVAHLGFVEADVDGDPGERRVVGHRQALGERGVVQVLLEVVLNAVGQRQVQKAMGVEGVPAADAVEPEPEALPGGDRGHPVLHRPCLLRADLVLGGQSVGVAARFLR